MSSKAEAVLAAGYRKLRHFLDRHSGKFACEGDCQVSSTNAAGPEIRSERKRTLSKRPGIAVPSPLALAKDHFWRVWAAPETPPSCPSLPFVRRTASVEARLRLSIVDEAGA